MKEKINRRSFLQTLSLSSMAAMPGLDGLSKLLGVNDVKEVTGFVKEAYRLCTFENLMNLEFYFISGNDKVFIKEDGKLWVRYGQDEAYMVVRLPQQHIAEEYYIVNNGNIDRQDTAQAIIAGYSYLTFRFVFNENTNSDYYDFLLNQQNLLDWNNPKLRLVVKQNLSKSIFEINTGDKKENIYPIGYENKHYNKEKFPSAYQVIKLDKDGKIIEKIDPSPITAIEAPCRLIISPKLPNQDIYDFDWEMDSTLTSFNGNVTSIENPLWTATLKLKKRAEVCIPKLETDKQKANKGSDTFKEDEKLKVIMIGSAYDTDANLTREEFKEKYKDRKILPEPKDLTDLVKLYTIWKLTARADKMTFSPLGITTKIDFKNTKINETAIGENKVSLVNWKQYISMGRDEQVEVAHLVMDAETGLKMLLVKTTKRRVSEGNAILEYREYLEPLEFEKDYTQFVVNKTATEKDNFHKGYSQNTYKYNIPFKKIEILERERKQVVSNKDSKFFWAKNPKDNLALKFKYKFTHWDGSETIADKKIFVLRGDLTFTIEGDSVQNPPKPDVINNNTDAEKTFICNKEEFYKKINKKEINIKTELESISAKFNSINSLNDTWIKIESEFGNIARRKVDFYKDAFNKYLKNYEERFKAEEDRLFKALGEKYYEFVNKKNQLKQRLLLIQDVYFNKILNKLNELEKIEGDLSSSIKLIEEYLINLNDLFDNGANKIKNELQALKTKINIHLNKQLTDSISKIYKEVIISINEIFDIIEKAYSEVYFFINDNLSKVDSFVKDGLNDINRILYDLKKSESEIKNKIELGRQKVNFVINEIERKGTAEVKEILNKALSEFETEYIILSANFKKAEDKVSGFVKDTLDFFDEFASFPQLHEAKIYVKAIKDLVNEDIPVSIKIAEDYLTSQANDLYLEIQGNASRVFAKVAEDSQEFVKGTMQKLGQEFGGIVNPEIAIEYMTFLQRKSDQVAKNVESQIEKLKKEEQDLIGEEKKALEAKIKELEDSVIGERKRILEQIKAKENEIKAQKDEIEKRIRDNLPIKEIEDAQNRLKNLRAELEGELKKIQQDLAFITEDAKEKFNQVKEWGEQQVISAQEYFKDLEAKILGQINIKDILGIDFELPRLNQKEGKIEYQFITDKLQPVVLGPFSFKNYLNTNTSKTSQLLVHFDKSISNSSYNSWTRLSNFNIGIMDNRLVVNFERLEIKSSNTEKRKVNVKLGEIEFNKELAFLKNLSDAVSKFIGVPGLSINIAPSKISVGYNFGLPSISGGAFSLANLKFFVGVNLPIPVGNGNEPISTTIGINSPNDKFVVAVGIFGGRGFFNLTTTPKHIQTIDAAIEFGGYFGIDLAIAKGEVFLMAGIRYTYSYADKRISFSGYLICGGSVSVFGFITVTVTFYLGLEYQQFEGRSTLYGTASLTYSVKIAFFKKSFTLTYSKRLYGADDKQNDTAYLMQEPEYYFAFADENPDDNGEVLAYYELVESENRFLPTVEEIKTKHQKRKENREKRKRKREEVNPNNLRKIFKDREDWRQYIRSYNYF